MNRITNLPSLITLSVLGRSITRASFLVMEDVYRCYRSEALGPVQISPRAAQELSDLGLIEAPKGRGGAVYPSERALDVFTLVQGDTDATDLGEPRNAFEGVFVPRTFAWETSDNYLPEELV